MEDEQGKFRDIVVAIIINQDKKVMMCEHIWIDNAWQFPQGGIEENENSRQAILRELEEEMGNNKFKIIEEMEEKVKYYFPLKHLKKGDLVGCLASFFLVKFFGEDKEIVFDKNQAPEFKNFKWVDFENPPKEVIYFKKLPYLKAINYFKERMKDLED